MPRNVDGQGVGAMLAGLAITVVFLILVAVCCGALPALLGVLTAHL